jgi:predicted GNAT family acetyltransferase
MPLNGFIEVSAVITHPSHAEKGYAKQLVSKTLAGIFNQNKIPFLQMDNSNKEAISLYQKLGFHTGKQVSFWDIT